MSLFGNHRLRQMALGLCLSALLSAGWSVQAAENALVFQAYQQQPIPAKLAWPDGQSPEAVKNWVVLLHGSGAHGMDADLGAVSVDQKPNPFFRDLSAALVAQGFGVMRYDKRNYVVTQQYQQNPAIAQTESFKAFVRQPLTYFVEDAKAAVNWLHGRYPQARVHLLGHSEGSWVALQAAATMPQAVQGVGLIGFFPHTLETAVFEQFVYRDLPLYSALDRNGDKTLAASELQAPTSLAGLLRQQMSVIDIDGNGQLSQSEYLAAQYSNLLVTDFGSVDSRQDEARYPKVAALLPTLTQPVAFFVGESDNQTPAYLTRAVELVNRAQWKKPFVFGYFPGLGHALDPRTDYHDRGFRPADPAALQQVAEMLAKQAMPSTDTSLGEKPTGL